MDSKRKRKKYKFRYLKETAEYLKTTGYRWGNRGRDDAQEVSNSGISTNSIGGGGSGGYLLLCLAMASDGSPKYLQRVPKIPTKYTEILSAPFVLHT